MEIQPMSHLQPCKWLMCHGSFSRRSGENWEFRENIFKCLQQGRAGTVQGQVLGVLSVCEMKEPKAPLGCLIPSPSSCWGSTAATALGWLGFPCLPSGDCTGQQLSLTLLLPGLWQPNSCTCLFILSWLSCAR